jgi:hypothetical protein
VLGNDRLGEPEVGDQIVHRTLSRPEQVEQLAAARLGDRVERVRCRRRPCHVRNRMPIQTYVKAVWHHRDLIA